MGIWRGAKRQERERASHPNPCFCMHMCGMLVASMKSSGEGLILGIMFLMFADTKKYHAPYQVEVSLYASNQSANRFTDSDGFPLC
jgi:hypothetical protein